MVRCQLCQRDVCLSEVGHRRRLGTPKGKPVHLEGAPPHKCRSLFGALLLLTAMLGLGAVQVAGMIAARGAAGEAHLAAPRLPPELGPKNIHRPRHPRPWQRYLRAFALDSVAGRNSPCGGGAARGRLAGLRAPPCPADSRVPAGPGRAHTTAPYAVPASLDYSSTLKAKQRLRSTAHLPSRRVTSSSRKRRGITAASFLLAKAPRQIQSGDATRWSIKRQRARHCNQEVAAPSVTSARASAAGGARQWTDTPWGDTELDLPQQEPSRLDRYYKLQPDGTSRIISRPAAPRPPSFSGWEDLLREELALQNNGTVPSGRRLAVADRLEQRLLDGRRMEPPDDFEERGIVRQLPQLWFLRPSKGAFCELMNDDLSRLSSLVSGVRRRYDEDTLELVNATTPTTMPICEVWIVAPIPEQIRIFYARGGTLQVRRPPPHFKLLLLPRATAKLTHPHSAQPEAAMPQRPSNAFLACKRSNRRRLALNVSNWNSC
eukprot:GHVT01064962.1.p1 GENE.GHVT01064962.1~~GHVT01064962.1.p1  ORF type:complete len:489 (+),score=63.55 GHVT01064962.1:1058-2524(+)